MHAQVCWKKFSLYFEVELRAVPVKGEHNLVMHMPDARQHVDENTIGVVAIFGSTYNGHLEDVAALDSIIGTVAHQFSLPTSSRISSVAG